MGNTKHKQTDERDRLEEDLAETNRRVQMDPGIDLSDLDEGWNKPAHCDDPWTCEACRDAYALYNTATTRLTH